MEEELIRLAEEGGFPVDEGSELDDLNLIENDLVIYLGALSEEIVAVATEHPQVSFLTVDPMNVSGPNIFPIYPETERADIPAFSAGVIAAMITPDWRIGSISLGGESSRVEEDAFMTGMSYYCGLCRQIYPPFYDYPISIELVESSEKAFAEALRELESMGVETVYLSTSIQELAEEVNPGGSLKFLAGFEPGSEFETAWVATIAMNPAELLRQAWERALTGETSVEDLPAFELRNVNSEYLSVGREDYAREVLQSLNQGMIETIRR